MKNMITSMTDFVRDAKKNEKGYIVAEDKRDAQLKQIAATNAAKKSGNKVRSNILTAHYSKKSKLEGEVFFVEVTKLNANTKKLPSILLLTPKKKTK